MNPLALLVEVFPFLALLIFIVLSFAAIIGWGVAFRHALGLSVVRPGCIGDFWLGYLFALIMVEFLNLWLPIDWRISGFYFAIGLILFIKYQTPYRRDLLAAFRRSSKYSIPELLLFIISLILVLFACSWAMVTPINEDSWSYHFQSIRWINEYPIVPGLGNLHGRLAFNQSHFGFLALLNFFPYWNKGYAAGGLLLLLATAFTAISVIFRAISSKRTLLVLLLLVIEPMARYSASPSPDFAVSLLQIVAVIYFVYLLYSSPIDAKQRDSDFLAVTCVCAALCTVKLSGLVFAAAVLGAAWWSSRGLLFLGNRKIFFRLSLVVVFFALTHLARGVITSGVPLYPITLGFSWHHDWSVPLDRIRNEAGWIYSCARTGSPCVNPDLLAQDWSWVDSWWNNRVPTNAKVLCLISVIAFTVASWVQRSGSGLERAVLQNVWLLMFPFLSALIFWFFSAPDVRFLGRLIELMFAASVWSVMRSLGSRGVAGPHTGSRRFLAFPILHRPLIFSALLSLILLIFCFRLLPTSGFRWAALPEPAVSLVTSAYGVPVHIPLDGSCWFQKLPCTPSVDPQLEYRDPANLDPLANGFRIHGIP